MKKYFIIIILNLFIISGCLHVKPVNIGHKNGILSSCPSTPNCVSTQSKEVSQYIKPLSYKSSKEVAYQKLIEIINSFERTQIITKDDNYIHAIFISKIMRYVDDVEFYFDEKNNIIHFRSASRVGYSDLGVNRTRMEMIRKLFSNDE